MANRCKKCNNLTALGICSVCVMERKKAYMRHYMNMYRQPVAEDMFAKIDQCEDCGSNKLVYDYFTFEIICSECGRCY